ncbi:MAG: prolipoprotein diacylglyceryl transferase [Intrasporangium sp.]|uniref:prolipoprotein diacylglyceryl transferase n=1 Tax=Intrasporangium sp. TaxID=1925024 RepID=UPI002649ADFF|nr:prolipoprotein diacylglyceryl transferase [Intrasporangium sp.]MDN5795668.1 prolipoprotein diacylglyceryl transferase [Intrasporangium sp.]
MTALSGIPAAASVATYIPSPTQAVWYLGPIPIRAYALCILAGIVVAVWWTDRRLVAGGARKGVALDISAWAVPFGIVGGRIYHLITTPQPYFGPGGHPMDAFAIWNGGLGIWGAVALGALGVWIGCRRHGVTFTAFADAAAPGLLVAQAMGRFGNYFNNEIYGGPTTLPWRLKVYEWDQALGHAVTDASGDPIVLGYFHPTFLYESIWCLLLAAGLIWLERHLRLAAGQTFAAYVMGYPVGRIVIENMRSDAANHILGQRVNTWVSILVFLIGLLLWIKFGRAAPRGRHRDAPTAAPPAPARGEKPGGADRAEHGADSAEHEGAADTAQPADRDGPA